MINQITIHSNYWLSCLLNSPKYENALLYLIFIIFFANYVKMGLEYLANTPFENVMESIALK